jgi:hypothetical protein
MDTCVEGLVASLTEVRRTEQLLSPSSWAADDLMHAPLPLIEAAVKKVFLAVVRTRMRIR